MKVSINNEYGRLKTVVMARVDNFFEHQVINDTQAVYYGTDKSPKLEVMKMQQRAFAAVLESHGVNIIWANQIEGAPEQTHARDISFCIGKNFFVSPMKEPVRQIETEGLKNIIRQIETPIYYDLCGVIEGGDVMVDNGKVYIGFSQRTDEEGLAALSDIISKENFKVVPIQLKEGYLHLDTVFNIFAPGAALVYPDAIENESLKLLEKDYKFFTVSRVEQFTLGTNTFSISPDTLVCDPGNKDALRQLKTAGYNVIEVSYGEIAKTGGLFRCGTCPLVRV